MDRSSYAFQPLSEADYETIISFGTMQGVSPILGRANYDSFIAGCRALDLDPRVILSALLWEDHFGTDPNGGVQLAKVFNFGGIKWAGQQGAFDSGIPYPANEGVGDYAGFHDFGSFILELGATLNNQYCGPAFRTGNLVGAWAIYVGGPNNPNDAAGQARVDQWQYYLAHYPPVGGSVVDTGVYGEDLVAVLLPHLGEDFSDGSLDPWNGPHPWPGYCLAMQEGAQYAAGLLNVVHRVNAALKLDAVVDQGLLQTSWPPEDGGCCLWGRSFDPKGHATVWSAAKGMWISTLYPTHHGLDFYYSDSWRAAMAGWFRAPGVVAAARTTPVVVPVTPQTPFFVDSNPYGPIPVRDLFWARWDSLNAMGEKLDHPGAINPKGLALPTLGFPVEPEITLPTGRRIQRFERGYLAFDNGGDPFNVVTLMLNEQPKGAQP